MEKDLIQISKSLINNIEKIDDLVDSYFEPIKDLTETAEDLFAPIKIVHSLYTSNKKRKFKSFLKYYAKSLDSGNFQNLKNTERLKKYLSNDRNFNFVNDTIESAINSKSIYGSMLLGYFAGQILADAKPISFKELILLEGLKELNDFELSYFTKIYSVVDLAKEVNIYQHKTKLGNQFLCEVTINKLLQLRIVDEAPIRIADHQRGRFISSEISEEIYEMIQSAGIENDLLNYNL